MAAPQSWSARPGRIPGRSGPHRAGRAIDGNQSRRGADLFAAVERLIDPEQMGILFKALAFMPPPPPSRPDFEMADPQIHRAANLALPGIAHGFFGRSGGVSNGIYACLNCGPGSRDEPAAVAENRALVTAALGPGQPAHHPGPDPQPHGSRGGADWDGRPAAGDGMVTAIPGHDAGHPHRRLRPGAVRRRRGARDRRRPCRLERRAGRGAGSDDRGDGSAGRRARAASPPPSAPALPRPITRSGRNSARAFCRRPRQCAFFAPSARPGHFRFDLEAYVAGRLARAGVSDIVPTGALHLSAGERLFLASAAPPIAANPIMGGKFR